MNGAALESIITAVLCVGCGLLVLAGVSKLRVPDPAMAALHRLRLPSGRVAARTLGLGEVTAGLLIVVSGGRPAAAGFAITYLAMTGVSAWQRRAQVACGCFGSAATVVSRTHVAANAVLAAAGALGVLVPPVSLGSWTAAAGTLAAGAGVVLLVTGAAVLRMVLEQAAAAQLRAVR